MPAVSLSGLVGTVLLAAMVTTTVGSRYVDDGAALSARIASPVPASASIGAHVGGLVAAGHPPTMTAPSATAPAGYSERQVGAEHTEGRKRHQNDGKQLSIRLAL